METWKTIPGFERYQVSTRGNIRSVAKKWRCGQKDRILSRDAQGYLHLQLVGDSGYRNCLVHRLVMLAHVGPPESGVEVNHKNGVKHDNRLTNLEYVSPSQNVIHSGQRIGESNGNSKLGRYEVLEIRVLAGMGCSQTVLAKKYGVSQPQISAIVTRRSWQHV